jgi:hypothetical protein
VGAHYREKLKARNPFLQLILKKAFKRTQNHQKTPFWAKKVPA